MFAGRRGFVVVRKSRIHVLSCHVCVRSERGMYRSNNRLHHIPCVAAGLPRQWIALVPVAVHVCIMQTWSQNMIPLSTPLHMLTLASIFYLTWSFASLYEYTCTTRTRTIIWDTAVVLLLSVRVQKRFCSSSTCQHVKTCLVLYIEVVLLLYCCCAVFVQSVVLLYVDLLHENVYEYTVFVAVQLQHNNWLYCLPCHGYEHWCLLAVVHWCVSPVSACVRNLSSLLSYHTNYTIVELHCLLQALMLGVPTTSDWL